jgi:hypothetical protein
VKYKVDTEGVREYFLTMETKHTTEAKAVQDLRKNYLYSIHDKDGNRITDCWSLKHAKSILKKLEGENCYIVESEEHPEDHFGEDADGQIVETLARVSSVEYFSSYSFGDRGSYAEKWNVKGGKK